MRLRALAFGLLIACGPGQHGPGGGDDQPIEDSDGDGISDVDEGRAQNVDTDHDGVPDYLDMDSDGDGIPDDREAGDTDLATLPVDSDADGIPDFRDTDSDNNGRTDDIDGTEDHDHDGIPDYADLDDDGDNIKDIDELGPNPLQPLDTDGDGIPDFRDTDSDNDTIADAYETNADYDNDGVPNFQDTDSDGDCIPDMLEARGNPPADTDGDTHPDFLDRDADNDGLTDSTEDANCNGTRDGNETSATNVDTDGDGVSDLVEVVAGTNPNDPNSNPQANGDFVFVEPYQNPQTPTNQDLNFSTKLQAVDMYVLLDRSGSMSSEITAVKNNLSFVVGDLTCPPLGNGNPATCIPDLWAGAGTIGYFGNVADAFQSWVDIQPAPSFASVPITEPSDACCRETTAFASYAAVTGQGGASFGMSAVPARASCVGSPAQAHGYPTFGYPCFRQGALPVVLVATDEGPLNGPDTYHTPDWNTVIRPQFTATHARLVGILGSAPDGFTVGDLNKMATDTGAVDANNGNAPLVFDGAGANAATAIETGIRTLATGLPLDINAVSIDDPSDGVDSIAAFVDHIQTLQLGTAQCAAGLSDVDTNGDSFKDKFLQVKTGTPVCWKVVSKVNNTVPAIDAPQLFRATVTVFGDSVTQLDQRHVFFLVPPKNPDILQ